MEKQPQAPKAIELGHGGAGDGGRTQHDKEQHRDDVRDRKQDHRDDVRDRHDHHDHGGHSEPGGHIEPR
jgi:hypothetical protein